MGLTAKGTGNLPELPPALAGYAVPPLLGLFLLLWHAHTCTPMALVRCISCYSKAASSTRQQGQEVDASGAVRQIQFSSETSWQLYVHIGGNAETSRACCGVVV